MSKLFYQAKLNQLLQEDVASAKVREQSAFDEATAPFGKSLVLFGAGNLGKKTLAGLRSAGIEPLAFSDNNRELWGKKIEGIEVFSPSDAAAKFGKSAAFIMAIWRGEGTDTMAERCQPLTELGCERVVNFGVVFWKYPQAFLPHYSFDLPHKVLEQADEVRRAFDLFEDDASRAEYVAQIRWRLLLDFDGLPRPVKHRIYFPEDIIATRPDDVFVDCGAYNGDTLEDFVGVRGEAFQKYLAFEADPANYLDLQRNVGSLPEPMQKRIRTFQLAVGARREKVFFNASGTGSSAVGCGTLEIDCAPLDEVIGGEEPTWIKMDIEGSEVDALNGARMLIAKTTPALAVCVYHQQNHVWRIPLLMREMSEDYRLFLRPHVLESWDLVCYAIPVNRLISTPHSS